MIETKVKNTKLIIVIAMVLIVPMLLLGVMKLDGEYYWQKEYISMQWLFATTRIEYILQNSHFLNRRDQDETKPIEAGKFASSVPVLLYHGVIEDPDWTPDDVNVRLADFKKQMLLLKSMGYETVRLEDFLAFTRDEKNLPAKSFVLTFDDGRKDSYYPVDPILKALGYEAVMFVITGRSLAEDKQSNTFHLTEVELKKMVKSGRWEIESHTQNGHDFSRVGADGAEGHFISNKLWQKFQGRMETDAEYRERVKNDLIGSKDDIEKKLGVSVKAFAYPFGDFGTASVNYPESKEYIGTAVRDIFPYSFYQARESDYIGNYPSGQHLLKRMNVNSEFSPDKLVTAILNSQDKTAPVYEDKFQNDKGWIEGWGKREFKNGLMLTGPTGSEDSSLTFLNGSYLWQDYTFKSEVQLLKGQAFALLARFHDGNNYVSCDFAEEDLFINEHRDGQDYTLAQIPFSSQIFSVSREVGVSARGQAIGCLVDGKEVIGASVGPTFSQGGIGFKTWDSKLFNSGLLIKKVNVTDLKTFQRSAFKGVLAR